MRHGILSLAAGLLAPALLVSLGAAPGLAQETPDTTPDVAGLEAKLEQMQRDMDEMRRQLERSQQQPMAAETAEPEAAGDELDRLRQLADEEALPDQEGLPTEKSFIARGLGLQALNPELSIAGDFHIQYLDPEDEPSEMAFRFRVLDIHFESYLDPYSKMKAAVGVSPDGAELGEAYFTRFAVLPGFNITAGKFRQQFGVVNRWHKHALDQIDFPMPLMRIFGGGGLNQAGLSFDWTLPEFWDASHKVMLQFTGGQNNRVFGENSRHLPSLMGRYQHYRDLSKDTYLEIGVTGLAGWNDRWESSDGLTQVRDTRQTWMAGGDITLHWEPTERMRYASFEWRTEFYYLDKGILAPDGFGRDRLRAWGAYTSLRRQISRTLEIGVRVDYYEPDSKSYADDVAPLAVDGSAPKEWQIGPYITWWQSPFVKLRFEVNYLDRYADHHRTGPSELTCTAQIVFAAGPHKHERY